MEFGLTGENGQGVAAPASNSANPPAADAASLFDQGGGAQNPAEPGQAAAGQAAGVGENGQGVAAPADGEPGDGGEQTPEQRHANAERRRQAEERARRAAEQARTDKIYADMFAGQLNPYTSRPIQSEADFRAMQEAAAAEARRNAEQARAEQLRQAGIDPGIISQLVADQVAEHPAVKNAAQAAELARREAGKSALENELKAIAAIDPSIKTLDDLMKMPNAESFDELVRGGLSLINAYKIANFDAVGERKAAAARQTTLNNLVGKGHLSATSGQGAGAVEVPAETMAYYRDLLPGMTDEQIRKHYAKHHTE